MELEAKQKEKAAIIKSLEGLVNEVQRTQNVIEALDTQDLSSMFDSSFLQELISLREKNEATLAQKFKWSGPAPPNGIASSHLLQQMEAQGSEVAEDHIQGILNSLNNLTFIG